MPTVVCKLKRYKITNVKNHSMASDYSETALQRSLMVPNRSDHYRGVGFIEHLVRKVLMLVDSTIKEGMAT